jgi:Trk K+ transport system NAD-binding subunit
LSGRAHHIRFDLSGRRRPLLRSKLRAEWAFVRVALRHFRTRFVVMVFVLIGGATAFRAFEPEKNLSFPQATFYTWSLVFGEPPEEFPTSPPLQALFFVIPVIGLTVIIEGIVDFALLLRDRRRHERSWCTMMAYALKKHVILVGLGKLGFRTFGLLRDMGVDVVVIERNPESQFLDVVRRDGSPLLIGDARREALLADANITKAQSIILASDDDLANLEIALDARRLHPDIRVVVRMFDQNMADKIRDGFNIHIAMSQSAISAPAFAASAIEESIVGSTIVDDRLIVMQIWHVRDGGPLCHLTVGDVLAHYGFSVVRHRPADGEAKLFPPPATRLTRGDELLVQGPFETLIELKKKSVNLA